MGKNKDARADAADTQVGEATNEPTTAIDAVADGSTIETDIEGADAKADATDTDEDRSIESELLKAASGVTPCEHPECPNLATHIVHRERVTYEGNGLGTPVKWDTRNCLQHIGPVSTYTHYEKLQ